MAEWADLGEGLLDLVISKLFDQDRYNFRLVCRSWNFAAAFSPYPTNAPCFIHYNKEKLLWEFFQYKSFFYRSFPEFDNAEIVCSKYGWLLMCRDKRSLFFFNPFNRQHKPIFELHSWCENVYNSIHFFHPPTSPDCFIIGISPLGSDGVIVDILKYGKNEWESSTYKNENEYKFLVTDSAPVLHHTILYFVSERGDVATLDIERCAWTIYPESLEFRKLRTKIRRTFLFKINGDEDALYVVFMIHDRETVNVFRLLEPEMKWERVKDLGDKMLYLSRTSSFGDVAKPKSMANTICFPIFDSDDNLLFYSLKTQRYHSFDDNYSFDNTFGLARVHYDVAWITPIPTQQLSTGSIWYSDEHDSEVDDDDDGDDDDDDNSSEVSE